MLKPAKRNGVAILNMVDYIKGISDIFSLTHEIKEVTSDPAINRVGKL